MKAVSLLLACLLLTSCAALPAEERAFAVILGVERGEAWRVHVRIPTYQSGGGYMTVTGEGDNLPAALTALDDNAPMRLSLSQVRLIVLRMDAPDVPAALQALAQRPDMRLQASLAMTEEDLSALMDAMKPPTGARLSKSIDVLRETRIASGAAPDATLSDVVRMGQRQSPLLMDVTLRDGAVDLLGGWALGETALPLSVAEMQRLALMMGGVSETDLEVSGAGIPLRDISAKVDYQAGIATLTLTARATAQADVTALENALAADCLALLDRLTAHGCDALGLARRAVRREDLSQWQAAFPGVTWQVRTRITSPI